MSQKWAIIIQSKNMLMVCVSCRHEMNKEMQYMCRMPKISLCSLNLFILRDAHSPWLFSADLSCKKKSPSVTVGLSGRCLELWTRLHWVLARGALIAEASTVWHQASNLLLHLARRQMVPQSHQTWSGLLVPQIAGQHHTSAHFITTQEQG